MENYGYKFASCHKKDITIVTDGERMTIDKDMLNEQNISAFTINDIIASGLYDNLRKILERTTKFDILRRLIRSIHDIHK